MNHDPPTRGMLIVAVREEPQSRRERHTTNNGMGISVTLCATPVTYTSFENRVPGVENYQVIGLLVPVSSTHYYASTSGLSTQ